MPDQQPQPRSGQSNSDTTYSDTGKWTPPEDRLREQGQALLRAATDLEGFLAQTDPESDPESIKAIRHDAEVVREVGHWLVHTRSLDGNALGFRVTGLR